MAGLTPEGASRDGADGLKFIRHPYSPARYAAHGENHVRVEQDDLWGEFNRDGVWIEGPLRHCDPMFARWVTGEHIYKRVRAERERQS